VVAGVETLIRVNISVHHLGIDEAIGNNAHLSGNKDVRSLARPETGSSMRRP
jgi:hypothetical protein